MEDIPISIELVDSESIDINEDSIIYADQEQINNWLAARQVSLDEIKKKTEIFYRTSMEKYHKQGLSMEKAMEITSRKANKYLQEQMEALDQFYPG
jgi:hypothetical protein